ncbi:MAG: hypothetical protein RH947_15100 [Alcanivorax sp.]|mgnify:CR=1 FL=1|jgi:hypothetical protein
MAKILKKRVENIKGMKWVRTHAVSAEGGALCFNPEYSPEMEGDVGEISCVDCVAIIEHCQTIDQGDLRPEYDNELFSRRFRNQKGR